MVYMNYMIVIVIVIVWDDYMTYLSPTEQTTTTKKWDRKE